MTQPNAYNRATDFTARDGDDTDHPALNVELDNAATSINQLRANLAQLQDDDGGLKDGSVTLEALAPGVRQGIPGPQGAPGAQGPAGPVGLTGQIGDPGPAGPVGARGVAGPIGPQGAQGPQGLQGATGPQGIAGIQGPQGVQGASGSSFTVNAAGLASGRNAYDSQPAQFAYLATDTGLLSIRLGATAGTWSAGIPFGRGEVGPQGPQGAQGTIGPQGNAGIQGPQGQQGLQGANGDAGLNWRGGYSPLTTYNADDAVFSGGSGWIALQTVTGTTPSLAATTVWSQLVSRGDTGIQGPRGLTGSTGPQGNAGPGGPAGPQGIQGPTGSTGPAGSQGPQGAQGPQGPQGPVGAGADASSDTQLRSLGVGTPASGQPGEIRAVGNVTAYYSDDRLKTRLLNIPQPLAKLRTLDGFLYHANDLAQSMGYLPKIEAGVSAQQVQAVLPEVVSPAPIDDKYLTVDYARLVPLLIEAIKELDREVAQLRADLTGGR